MALKHILYICFFILAYLHGNNAQASCAAGSYSASAGSTECKLCTSGKYSTAIGAVTDICTSCTAGKYSTGIGAITDICISCSSGKYATQIGAGNCTSCSDGSFSVQVNSSDCESCEKTFVRHNNSCTCQPGKYFNYSQNPLKVNLERNCSGGICRCGGAPAISGYGCTYALDDQIDTFYESTNSYTQDQYIWIDFERILSGQKRIRSYVRSYIGSI